MKKMLQNKYEFSQQGVFLFLTIITSLLLCCFLLFLWIVPTIGFSAIYEYLSYIIGSIVVLCVSCILWGVLCFIVQVYTGKVLPGVLFFRLWLNGFFPFIVITGRFLCISLKNIRYSFIEINNRLVDKKRLYKPQDVLLLLPHCIQASVCKLRLTYNSDNCVRCGQCTIGDLLDLRDKWGIQMATATGGTMARNIIKKIRPKLIIGSACERDLVSGIQDVGSLPVIGVLNDCSKGVCMDTSVDVNKIEAILNQVIDYLGEKNVQKKDIAVESKSNIVKEIPVYKDVLEGGLTSSQK